MKLKIAITTGLISLAMQAQVPFVKERNHINLTDWIYTKGINFNAQKNSFDVQNWQAVKVPHTYSMDAINAIGYYRGESWYRTPVTIPQSMDGQRIFIRFEGVGQQAELYFNEKKIGEHKGGYSAFCYEITDLAQANKSNLLAVKVTNEPDFKVIPTVDKLFNLYGGIYRPVQVFSTPKTNINPNYYASSGVFVELKELQKDLATIQIRTHLSTSKPGQNSTINYTILDAKNKVVAQEKRTISSFKKDTILSENFQIKKPILWNGRQNPHRYHAEISVTSNNETDKINQSFGIKTVSANADTGFHLNNEPYRLYGVAMHQEWEQNGPALSDQQHQQDMDLVDEIGATGIRLSHYQHSELTYELADEKGILVWTEIPFVHDYSSREDGNAKQQLTELILQNYNHPSIFTWGLWNEVRAHKSKNEPCVLLVEDLKKLAHKLDPNRLTASASDRGITGNMENITDLQAWNKYFGWYGGKYGDFAKWLDEAHTQNPTIPLGISEYGSGANIKDQDETINNKPFGIHFPEIDQTHGHEITWKIIKDRPFVWGSFVWNMFDFSVAGWNRGGVANRNHKGLITYDRSTKKDAFYFYKTNWNSEPQLYIAERRNTNIHSNPTTVKIYTNQPAATLYLNGKKIATQKLTSDIRIIEFKNIELQKGNNKIEVKAGKLSDEINWILP
ncbi:glycoside hydrolase family 2 TIM barrel-domain containing protein [Flavobacterium ovatum]|uniref:glycoside hydrolase family 2 protein n=1 Tax=Flavobacterium ovatum TaxID=1928857 RepID=UPI00344E7681